MNLSNILNNSETLLKVAKILLVIGVLLPSITYPLSKLTNEATLKQVLFAQNGVKYDPTFDEYELVLYSGNWVKDGYNKGHYEYRVSIPFNYIFVASIIILSCGGFTFYRGNRMNTHNNRVN